MTDPRLSTWLVVGSSPSARAGLDYARHMLADTPHMVITTNGGIMLVPEPDVFLIHDPAAAKKFDRHIRAARAVGTRIVKSRLRGHRQAHVMAEVDADEVIWSERPDGTRYRTDAYVSSGTSGSICAQWAVKHGAEHVVMVGMEGYLSDGAELRVETFDGRRGHRLQWKRTVDRYGPFMGSMCQQLPAVRFTWIGRPIYDQFLDWPNAWIVELNPTEKDDWHDYYRAIAVARATRGGCTPVGGDRR